MNSTTTTADSWRVPDCQCRRRHRVFTFGWTTPRGFAWFRAFGNLTQFILANTITNTVKPDNSTVLNKKSLILWETRFDLGAHSKNARLLWNEFFRAFTIIGFHSHVHLTPLKLIHFWVKSYTVHILRVRSVLFFICYMCCPSVLIQPIAPI